MMRSGPRLPQLEKALAQNEGPTQPKIKKQINLKKLKKKKDSSGIPIPLKKKKKRISGGRTQPLLEGEEEALPEAGSLEEELLQDKCFKSWKGVLKAWCSDFCRRHG